MRIPILRFLTTVTCILLSLVVAPAFSHADTVVYDNTQNSMGGVALKGFVEFGNTITLDDSTPPPNDRVVTQFSVGYLPFAIVPGSEGVNTTTLDVRFYSDTNALLYNSGLISIPLGVPDAFQMQILTLDHLAVEVTNTFRWTVQFGGINTSSYFPGGLFMFGPPTVGSFVSVYPGATGIVACPGGVVCDTSTQSFYAQVQARPGNAPVPEPSSFLLLTVGLVGLAAWRRKQLTP